MEITILCKADGCLIGSRARMNRTRWAELLFADNMAVITRERSGMVHALQKLCEVTSHWGLTVSVPKSEVMSVGCEEA